MEQLNEGLQVSEEEAGDVWPAPLWDGKGTCWECFVAGFFVLCFLLEKICFCEKGLSLRVNGSFFFALNICFGHIQDSGRKGTSLGKARLFVGLVVERF